MTDAKIEDVYAQLNIAKILVAALETLGEISVPVSQIINAENEDKEVQVDYSEEEKTFTFKLKIKGV
jgi:hypothetical protein